jgi:hypothetical protein
MAAMSDYLENQIVDHIFRTASFTKPTNVYIGLFTAAPSDSGGGTEVTGGSYAREGGAPLNTLWNGTHGNTTGASSGTGGLTDNAADVTFTTATAAWGTVTHIGVFDAVTGGNLLIHGILTASKVIGDTDTFKINAGDFDITLA